MKRTNLLLNIRPKYFQIYRKLGVLFYSSICEEIAVFIQPAPDLYEAGLNRRVTQKVYMADRGNEELGRAVGEAAADLDAALAKASGE